MFSGRCLQPHPPLAHRALQLDAEDPNSPTAGINFRAPGRPSRI